MFYCELSCRSGMRNPQVAIVELTTSHKILGCYKNSWACVVQSAEVPADVYSIPGSRFGVPAQANQAFYSSGESELVPDSSGRIQR